MRRLKSKLVKQSKLSESNIGVHRGVSKKRNENTMLLGVICSSLDPSVEAVEYDTQGSVTKTKYSTREQLTCRETQCTAAVHQECMECTCSSRPKRLNPANIVYTTALIT